VRRIAEQLAESFFGAEIEGHEDLDGDAAAAVVEFLDSNYFAEGFLIDGAGGIGIGEGDEEAHAFLIGAVFGDEVDAVLSSVVGGKDFVEIMESGFGGSHADDTRKFQAAFAAAFLCS